MRRLPSAALLCCIAVGTAAACATSPSLVGASSDGSGGHGGLGASTSGSASSASGGQGGAGTTASSSDASSSVASTGQGGASAASSSGGASDAGVDCELGAACTVDLSQCSASQEAPAWQGQLSVQGTLELDFYTSHKGWVCQVPSVGQGWPVIPEPGWWCGTATPRCNCSPADQCH